MAGAIERIAHRTQCLILEKRDQRSLMLEELWHVVVERVVLDAFYARNAAHHVHPGQASGTWKDTQHPAASVYSLFMIFSGCFYICRMVCVLRGSKQFKSKGVYLPMWVSK